MIYIKEDYCKKLSGLTSLFISFNFNTNTKDVNTNIVCALKSCDTYVYDKKTHIWELLPTSLAYLLDNLTYLDDINLELLEENKVESNYEPILDYKLKPFEYQYKGITYGLNHNKWLLLDDMGLGKTAQMIGLARELKAQKNIQHCLIICGVASLKTNWKREIQKHSDETCVILGERINKKGNLVIDGIKERIEMISRPLDEFFFITNIETLRSDEFMNALENSPNKIDMIVVDEIHKCKSVGRYRVKGKVKTVKQSTNLLRTKAEYKIGLTGTPVLNSPIDLFAYLKWIEKENATLTQFKSQYCNYDSNHKVVSYKNLNILKDELDSCSLRRLKEDELKDLPSKTIVDEFIDMDSEHMSFYTSVKNGVKEEADKIKLNLHNMEALIIRLRQATVCPSILTSQDIQSSKLERCLELVNDLVESGNKVVVFSTFKESLYELNKMIEYDTLVCTGDTNEIQDDECRQEFLHNKDKKIFLGTWSKCGTGFDLTSASYMIFLDTPWTYGVFNQASDRIYRIGTKDKVFIYNLICNNTIDEIVRKILNKKKAIGKYLTDEDSLDEDDIKILARYIFE